MPTTGEIAENAINAADAAAENAAHIAMATINDQDMKPLDIMLLCLICHALINAGLSSPEYSALEATARSIFHEWVVMNRVSISRRDGFYTLVPVDFSKLPAGAEQFFEHEFARITQERQAAIANKDECQ